MPIIFFSFISTQPDGTYTFPAETGLGITQSGNYIGTFTAAADSVELRFQMPAMPSGADTGYFWLDDVWVDEIIPYEGGGVSGSDEGYRYGFNGKEKSDEIKGKGNSLDYGARIQDPRLGRWLSVDPMASRMPGESPYSSMGNNPILNIDPDGNFAVPVHKRITINAFYNSGLSKGFLSRFKTDLVVGATRYSDYYGFAFDHHFDGRKNFSEVQATWTKLNNDIDSRINNIGSGNKKFGGYDVERLGINVHNVQDFYSHSNYVELLSIIRRLIMEQCQPRFLSTQMG